MATRASEQELVARLGADVLAGRWGAVVRKAVEDRAVVARDLAVHEVAAHIRPDLLAAVDELLERMTDLAPTLHQLDAALDPEAVARLDRRLEEARRQPDDPACARLAELLERQRASLVELDERRTRLAKQLDSAALAIARVRYETRRARGRRPPA